MSRIDFKEQFVTVSGLLYIGMSWQYFFSTIIMTDNAEVLWTMFILCYESSKKYNRL